MSNAHDRSLRALERRLAELTAATPAVRACTFGASVNEQPLRAFTVGHEGTSETGGVLVLAGLHALEHVGAWAALALLERASSVESAWRRRRLTVVPVANPDGYRAVDEARAAGRRGFARHNARGVDLNRNFASGWRDDYYLGRWFPRLFAPGSGPLSEPETRALDELATRERPAIVVSLHAFGEWIYLPWASRREEPSAARELWAIAEAMRARQERPYRIAQLGRRSRIFVAPGAELDHFHERHGALTFLFEIGAGPLGTPSAWFDPLRWYTPAPTQADAEIANVLPALDYLAEVDVGGGVGAESAAAAPWQRRT